MWQLVLLALDDGCFKMQGGVFYGFVALGDLYVSAIDIEADFACRDLAGELEMALGITDGGELGAGYGELYASQWCACVVQGDAC